MELTLFLHFLSGEPDCTQSSKASLIEMISEHLDSLKEAWTKPHHERGDDEGKKGDKDDDMGDDEHDDDKGSSKSKDDNTMQIHVKMPDGIKTMTMDVEPDYTIATVKAIIKTKAGIPRIQQRLIFDGKQLQDEHTLEKCSILNDAFLQLMLNLQGSGFLFYLCC
jgi:hypothetical protein